MEPIRVTMAPEQYLTFRLAGEEYGIGILRAREIVAFEAITEVPMMPPCVRGVTNLRGTVVPVVDLAIRFGQPGVALTRRTCMVIVEIGMEGGPDRTAIGVLVDSVSHVIDLTPDQIQAAPASGTMIRAEYLHGMSTSEEGVILLLDIDRILAPGDLLAAVSGASALLSNRAQPHALPATP